jgi:histone acetyltransferase 1
MSQLANSDKSSYRTVFLHTSYEYQADQGTAGSSDSNEAIEISLVIQDDGAAKALHTFNPKFTYSIFGDEESIFGYKGLKVSIRYHACDMRPSVKITWDKKFKTVGEVEPLDVKAALEEYLPKSEWSRFEDGLC